MPRPARYAGADFANQAMTVAPANRVAIFVAALNYQGL
jgi:hypothetical protein